ncbi:MAG: hypothetical protein AAF927_00925 [Bacteroidota bacterium]
MKRSISLLMGLLLLCLGLSAQGLDKFKNKPPLALSGSLRLSASYYSITGAPNTQNPFSWVLSGTPTLSVFGIKFPVSFSYRGSNLETNLQFPLNRFAASPSWKWGRLHLGQRSMRLTDYTLSGRDFNGVGVELNPGVLRFAALSGNFRNVQTQADSLTQLALILPSFKRNGFGGKLGVGTAQNYLDFIFMKIEDQEETIVFQSPEIATPVSLPKDNVVLGSDLKLTLFKSLSLRLNGAASLVSDKDSSLGIPLDTLNLDRWLEPLSKVIEPNLSTRWGLAGDAELSLKLKAFSIGAKYHRVDPYFRSLGTFFIRNDIESYTGKLGLRLWENKFNLNLQAGRERNNLSGLKARTQSRTIGSASLFLNPIKALQINLNYSNFQRDNESGFVEIEDTLRVVNLTQLQSLNISYRAKTQGPTLRLRASVSRQSIEDQSVYRPIDNHLNSLVGSFHAGLHWKEAGFRLTPSLQYRQMDFRGDLRQTYGFGLQLSQALLEKKLRLQARFSLRQTMSQQGNDNTALNLRASGRFKLSKRQNINLNLHYLSRQYQAVDRVDRSTFRLNFAYSFNF